MAPRLRIGLITQWFDPETGSAAVPGVIARSLARLDVDVKVITGMPSYPHGRVLSGYRGLCSKEVRDGLSVYRNWYWPTRRSSASARIVSYTSFIGASSVGLARVGEVDLYAVFSTPITVGCAPVLLQRRRPIVTMIQDLWPDSMLQSGLLRRSEEDTAFGRIAYKACDKIYGASAALTVISRGMKEELIRRGFNEQRIHYVPNWLPDVPPWNEPLRPRPNRGLDAEFRVVYAGNLGVAQGVRILLDAAEFLRSWPRIRFTIVGAGLQADELRQLAARLQLSNFEFLGPRSPSDAAQIMRAADAQIITLAPNRLFEITMPSKVQFSLAIGVPVIGAVSGDAAAVLKESGASLVGPPGDARALASNILALASMPESRRHAMGSAAQAYFRAHFSEQVGAARLMDVFQQVLQTKFMSA